MPKIITQIEIKRKKAESSDTRRPLDLAPLPRRIGRRRLREVRPYLRVWDTCQYADGTDRDDLTRHFGIEVVGNNPALTAFPTFNSIIFAVPYETWDTVFKEITDSVDDYNIDLGDFGDYVEGRGLESTALPPDVPNLHVLAQNKYFTTWLLPASTKIKITRTPVFSDPAATFTFNFDCDLFLVPGLHNRYGLAVYNGGTPAPGNGEDNVGYKVLSLQAPLPRSLVGSDEFDLIWANRVNSAAASVIDISYYRNLFLNDRTPQLYVEPPYVIVDANGFPTYSDHSPADWDHTPRLGFTPATKQGGTLLAAIRKNLPESVEWYFVWAGSGGYSPSDPVGIGASGAWAYGFGESIPGQEHLFGLLV